MFDAQHHEACDDRLQLAPAEKLLLASLSAWAASPTTALRRLVCRALADRTDGRVAALFSAWIQAVDAARLRPMIRCCSRCEGPGPDLQRLVLACGVARPRTPSRKLKMFDAARTMKISAARSYRCPNTIWSFAELSASDEMKSAFPPVARISAIAFSPRFLLRPTTIT